LNQLSPFSMNQKVHREQQQCLTLSSQSSRGSTATTASMTSMTTMSNHSSRSGNHVHESSRLLQPSLLDHDDDDDEDNDPQHAPPQQAPQMAGYCNVLREGGGGKRRFFVLSGPVLYYFRHAHDQEPRGSIDLSDARVTWINETDSAAAVVLALEYSDYRLVLEAPHYAWLHHLQQALHTAQLARLQHEHERKYQALSTERNQLTQERRELAQDLQNSQSSRAALEESCRKLTAFLKNNEESSPFNDAEEPRIEPAQVEPADGDAATPNEAMECALRQPALADLWNASLQLRHYWRLAAAEAATAVREVQAAQTLVQTSEQQRLQAQELLVATWEENALLRRDLVQARRERRVLVQEVKNLQQEKLPTPQAPTRVEHAASEQQQQELNEDELIDQLEAHLSTSMQLHEQLLQPRPLTLPKKPVQRRPSPRSISMDSLFDSDSEGNQPQETTKEHDASLSCSSSVVAEASTVDVSAMEWAESVTNSSTLEDQSGALLLEQEAKDDGPTRVPEVVSLRPPRGVPTCQLACPLADVVRADDDQSNPCHELQVYHLTFYSQKIGIQFQKVPPPPATTKGSITDAVAADLLRLPTSSNNTAAELRRIASLSSSTTRQEPPALRVSTPVDAVLVCGCHGFESSTETGHAPPRIGARLVAFDGISVEMGHWTFESIRKSIQARGRPLTLSFRNDFLTTEQRKILTRAINESSLSARLSEPATRFLSEASSHKAVGYYNDKGVQHGQEEHQPLSSRNKSVPPTSQARPLPEATNAEADDSSVASSVHWHSRSGRDALARYDVFPMSFSSAHTAASSSDMEASRSKSFFHSSSVSEVGSTSTSVVSALSSLAPSIVSNLLHRSASTTGYRRHHLETGTSFGVAKTPPPSYLTRRATSVRDTPQHQDFQSELI
jgi:PH domain